MNQSGLVDVGKVSAPYGIKGWLRMMSYTEPRKNILNYSPWLLGKKNGDYSEWQVEDARLHGKGLIVKFENIENPESAAKLSGLIVAVVRDQLPEAAEGEYFWIDLIGLAVITITGFNLGEVDYLIETGANDVLIVKGERERLIPFVQGDVIKNIDLKSRVITVDWDPDF
ncbi:MAG: ribosome maturation factor RimM [Methylococcales bacterium]